MKSGRGFLPNEARFPFSGLDTATPPAQLEPGASPNCVNMGTFRGTLKKRSGFDNYGTRVGSETIVRLFEFEDDDATTYVLAFTPTKQYVYSAGTWTNITGTTWTGTNDNYIDIAVGVDTNLGKILVAVNGKDAPIYWTGSGNFGNLTVNLANFVTAKTVAIFNSYCIFANIKTSSGWEPRTAAWSDTGVFTEWLSGNSGVLPEMAFDGEILRLIPFSTNLIVFSKNTIGCLCYINSDVIFGSQIYASGITLVGAAAVCHVAPLIMFAGQDNLYVWDGSRNVSPIGDKIALIYRLTQDAGTLNRSELFFDSVLGQIRFRYYNSSNTTRTFVCELNTSGGTFFDLQKSTHANWYENSYFVYPSTHARISTPSSSNRASRVLIGTFDGYVYQEAGEINDDGNAIATTFDTGDFTIPATYKSQLARWLEIEFEALGTSVTVSYSIDSGSSWTSVGATTLTTTFVPYRLQIDTTSRTLRLRFATNSVDSVFELAWYRVWFRPGGSR